MHVVLKVLKGDNTQREPSLQGEPTLTHVFDMCPILSCNLCAPYDSVVSAGTCQYKMT